MKPRILIGEMAKLHNISAQTLRYYDKIDLFKPGYIDEENNYRYYGIEQFAHLDSILFLKKLGVPLKDVRKYFNQRNLTSMIQTLEQNKIMILKEIELLKKQYDSIENKLSLIAEYSRGESFYKCRIKNIPLRKIAYLDFEGGGDEVGFEYGIKELSSLIKDDLSLFNGTIGCIIGIEELEKKRFNYFKSVAILFSDDNWSSLKDYPGGEFAVVAYKGKYEKGEEAYRRLLKWIRDNGYKISGEAVVLVIADSAFSNIEEEYINELQIPIKKP
ncbi:MerR family transcriptional regulator [Clostridium swellfunianum]|uniref:MerR family transcriptional regulator n=1 Tax=Clostridium swellfunianum TaxID=1367462 RepID=UPI00202EBC4C|nr:MerR family transcriptional regulator [Clostridium swellfunianum]MCM0649163.1 MerR family transcriptional regulator [Clostridium swellfunianum]